MTKNLNVNFKSLDGRDLTEDGAPINVGRLVANRLYYSKDVADKLRANALAINLFSAKGPIEMEKEDIQLIKDVMSNLAAGLYAQVVAILDANDR